MTNRTLTPAAAREQWLARAVRALRPMFAAKGYPLPARIAVSVSFATRATAIGQCFDTSLSASGKTITIIVCPSLSDFDALDTLVHELVHAAVGVKAGHAAPFRRCCKAIGLTQGRPRSAGAGPELSTLLRRLIATVLGVYPHDPVSRPKRRQRRPAGEGGRYEFFYSASCPSYVVKVPRKVWDTYPHPPVCPFTGEAMEQGRPV